MSATSMVIRPGIIADYSHAYEVIAQTFAFHQRGAPEFFRETPMPPPTQSAIARLLQDDAGAWFLAEQAGHIIGFVTVYLRAASQEPFQVAEVRAHVENLGILPAWQGHGVGRQLMAAAEQWARQHGAQRLLLNVWEFNHRAVGFYDNLGYTTFTRNMWKTL
jgi:diamine N-acetyltransferase